MKLILTRHGETIENKLGITQGHLPGKLSKLGQEQAQKLALRLKGEKIDAIYSSDLARAADTAKIIAQYHAGVPVYFVKELRERDHGLLTGKKKEEMDLGIDYKQEELSEMQKRVKVILDQAYAKHPYSTVLFVGHGAINNVLISTILNKPAEYAWEIPSQYNTAVNIFEIREDGKHKIHLLNCKKHLEE
jgi:probable phosphoglycerate mutase